MICGSCQALNKDGSLFCTSCGVRLAPPSPAQTSDWGSLPPAPGAGNTQQPADSAGWTSGFAGNQGNDATDWRGYRARPEGALMPIASSGSKGQWGNPVWPSSGQVSEQSLAPYGSGMVQIYGSSQAVSPVQIACAQCGATRPATLETCPYCGRALVNNSGQNLPAPDEIGHGWNWGAFAFPVFWSIAHDNWLGLLALIPGVDIIVRLVLGARGNTMAWQSRQFRSVEHFLEVQRVWRNWSIAGLALAAALIVMMIFGG